MPPDSGNRTLARSVRILELDQIPDRTIAQSLFEYVRDARTDILALRSRLDELTRAVVDAPDDEELHAKLGAAQTEFEHLGGYDLDRRVEITLGGLGFPTSAWRRPVGLLSGGERTRADLARLLLRPADLLLLDEPTNHLDIPAVEWLEKYLIETSAAVVLVSHDRVFLERFAGRVVDLAHHELEFYDGDYAYYRRTKPERRARQQKAFEMQAAEIARIEEFIAKNIAGQKTKQAQSRRKALGKLQRLEAPRGDGGTMRLHPGATPVVP
jgi:ATP-binding cassette subfamily F protein 3